MKKLKEVFKDAQVGNKVWHVLAGWGEIIKGSEGYNYPIKVQFESQFGRRTFDTYGREHRKNISPSLYKDEQKLDIEYEDPKIDWSKVPIDTLVNVTNRNSDIARTRRFIAFVNGKYTCAIYEQTIKTLTGVHQWKQCELHESVEPKEEWFK